MAFKKGTSGNLAGKPKGALNKLTRTVRDKVFDTFNELQEDDNANLLTWAKENPSDFYKIASKLIPVELNANIESNVITVIPPNKK
jgi:hypothetical protein